MAGFRSFDEANPSVQGMRDVVIVAAKRTPIGRLGGVLSGVRPDDLAAHVIRAVVDEAGIDAESIDEVIMGAANQAGEDNRNNARMAALLAGLPLEVPGFTVNRLCASGLTAVIQGMRTIRCGEADIIVAGGAESMSRAPFVVERESDWPEGSEQAWDTMLGWRMSNPLIDEEFGTHGLGMTAEHIAEETGISRERQDAFALESHRRALAAIDDGRMAEEIIPVPSQLHGEGEGDIDTDEHPRRNSTMEALARLRAVFKEGGTVTAGNSSGINDGAAAVVLMSADKAAEYDLTPLATLIGAASAGVAPKVMGYGPIPAVNKLLERVERSIDEIDVIELNEAFAVQSLACIDILGLDPMKVNPNGGAIALGHPLGCSGARILTTLIHELRRRGGGLGLATLCVGVGQGEALLIHS